MYSWPPLLLECKLPEGKDISVFMAISLVPKWCLAHSTCLMHNCIAECVVVVVAFRGTHLYGPTCVHVEAHRIQNAFLRLSPPFTSPGLAQENRMRA